MIVPLHNVQSIAMKINPFLSLLFLIVLINVNLNAQGFSPHTLRCEYKVNPNGIEIQRPRLSWQMASLDSQRNLMQTAYHIQVATQKTDLIKGKKLIWDSGRQDTDQSIHITYMGPPLEPRQIYFWRVKTWDNIQGESSWSEIAQWEMGLMDSTQWVASWIEPSWEEKEKEYNPVPYLRKTFSLNKNIVKARLYITARGVYEVYINGTRVGDEVFTPGWTSYKKRIQYQTYDVTDLLQAGDNVASTLLGDGWFRGQFGFQNNWNIYGDKTALLFQLEVDYKNGTKETIISDDQWKASTGAITMSSLYDGEVYDAALEKKGWMNTEYDDQNWQGVRIVDHPKSTILGPEGLPVRKMEEITAKDIMITPEGDTVVDMGQNMVGWIRLKVKGQAGDIITLTHAEVLDKDGNFYTANLRSAKQIVQYILDDTEQHVLEPHFSFQGFRYVKVKGYPDKLTPENFTGIVIYSDMKKAGSFECSNAMINQLQSNIEWGQKGNFLDVPTDCPQRDERMGWTGDAQAFASTACFNFDAAAFFTKWLQDLKADQLPNGSVPFVIPDVLGGNGSTGWADAATIIPWTMYLKYGDQRILERQYESMKSWVGYLEELSEGNYLVQEGFHFGDWLFFIHPTDWNSKPGHTDIDFLSTAFFAYSTQLTLETARILDRQKDVDELELLLGHIKTAFHDEFVTPSGRLSPHSQTAYTLALAFDLLPEDQRPKATEYLVNDIIKRNYHLSTGFLGTPHLCHVLSSNSYTDVAYKLLFQDSYPSWLYPITRGATTIWERWDGIKPDSSFQSVRMNSFNHYAYGAIGDWMYRVVAGIEVDPNRPGHKHILIQPQPTSDLTYARASHQSMYGSIKSSWAWENDQFILEIEIPPNTSATVKLPGAKANEIKESGKQLRELVGISDVNQYDDYVQLEIGSGSFVFKYRFDQK